MPNSCQKFLKFFDFQKTLKLSFDSADCQNFLSEHFNIYSCNFWNIIDRLVKFAIKSRKNSTPKLRFICTLFSADALRNATASYMASYNGLVNQPQKGHNVWGRFLRPSRSFFLRVHFVFVYRNLSWVRFGSITIASKKLYCYLYFFFYTQIRFYILFWFIY